MKPELVEQLTKLNRDFYQQVTPEFDQTRQHAWPGWSQVLTVINQNTKTKIVDLGCGNGRFYNFLATQDKLDYEYTGLDNSASLLQIARKQYPAARFIQADILQLNRVSLAAQRYDLVSLFGVSHHIPGRDNRIKLLKDASRLLQPKGLLVISFWQFAEYKRFTDKIRPWSMVNINEDELEPGDYLLNWNNTQTPRYCHFSPPQEAHDELKLAGLKIVTSFHADGFNDRLNFYNIAKLT